MKIKVDMPRKDLRFRMPATFHARLRASADARGNSLNEEILRLCEAALREVEISSLVEAAVERAVAQVAVAPAEPLHTPPPVYRN